MTSSIPPYPNMSGPSNYYQPNYPPAGPSNGSFQQYPYSQPPMPLRGNGRGGSPTRGGHHYHQQMPPYQYYNYPPGNYPPAAYQQQPLSPLPKQLSMPPPQSPYYPPSESVSSPQSQPSSAPSSPRPAPLDPAEKGSWVIWPRRPQDPSLAPAIIFSPGCKPPPNIIAKAMDLPLPPIAAVVQQEKAADMADDSPPSQSNSTVSSSAVTETTDTPIIPSSPISSSTSISVGTKDQEKPSEDLSSSWVEIEETAAEPAPEPETETTPVPPAVEVPASSPPTKKSWASLLKTSGSPSAGGASSSRLPTSSVVGFSIPASSSLSSSPAATAGAENDSTIAGLTPAKRTALISLLTTPLGPSIVNAAPPKIRSRGLVNTGNMCFANSVLQVLIYCPPFYHLFTELGKLLPPRKASSPKDGQTAASPTPLVDATIEFLKEFVVESESGQSKMTLKDASVRSNGKGKGKEKEAATLLEGEDGESDEWDESFIPTYVYDALKEKKRFDHMRGGHQEDAEEFFGFYLDTLEEELLSILSSISPSRPNQKPVEEQEEEAPTDDGWLEVGKRNRTVVTRTIKATESPITRIFGGKFRSTLKAPQQKDSVLVEDWRSLRLDIQREQVQTVQDALSYLSHPQSVQMTHSSRPGVIIEASQQTLIDALPPILVLHMKRFCYDKEAGGVVKVSKQAIYGPELEIPPEIMTPAMRKPQARYKLFGAIYHHGVSASGGHYTLDVLHPSRFTGLAPAPTASSRPFREGWIRIDDELVSDVSGADDVFNDREADSSRCAYLLFYRRIR